MDLWASLGSARTPNPVCKREPPEFGIVEIEILYIEHHYIGALYLPIAQFRVHAQMRDRLAFFFDLGKGDMLDWH